MLTQKDNDLQEILGYANLTRLPRALDTSKSKKVWVDGILEVRKVDCTVSYAYAYNRYGRDPFIVRTVGTAAAIREILSVHPINYLTKEFLPDVSSREDIIGYLSTVYGMRREDLSGMDADRLKLLLYTSCVDRQIDSIKMERLYGKNGKAKEKKDNEDKGSGEKAQ